MRDTASNDPSKIELSDIMLADMRGQLGRRRSPAFDRFRILLRQPSALPARVTVQIVEMLCPQCYAHTQSFRQTRGAALWAELHWLPEEMLIATYDELWDPQRYQWKASALLSHANAGPALWMHILSGPVHVRTILEIRTLARQRGYREFVEHLKNSMALVDIATGV